MFRKSQLLILFTVLIFLGQTSRAVVKNVVLMIGDGMGFEKGPGLQPPEHDDMPANPQPQATPPNAGQKRENG